MFFDNYPLSTSNLTSSIFLKGLKASAAVLLIHGYGGTPYEMSWFSKQLNDSGYNVLVPRLPGHATSKKDFLASSWKDWLRRVCDAYIDLSAQYEEVYVGGHSMGGLLASILAKHFEVKKLFLCAPAFKVCTQGAIPLWLTPIAKYFVKEIKKNDGAFFDNDEFNKLTEDYRRAHYVAKVADFYKIQKMAIKAIPSIRASSLIVLSKKDNVVPLSTKEFIASKIKAKTEDMILDKSGHLVLNDIEKEAVATRIIDFLK